MNEQTDTIVIRAMAALIEQQDRKKADRIAAIAKLDELKDELEFDKGLFDNGLPYEVINDYITELKDILR